MGAASKLARAISALTETASTLTEVGKRTKSILN
jgi:hypothetical protein